VIQFKSYGFRGFGDLGIKYIANRLGYSRFAIVVPVKVEKSVVRRNRLRRIVYDELAKFTIENPKSGDFMTRFFKVPADEKIIRKKVDEALIICLNTLA